MNALCPDCVGKGCDKCDNGTIQIKISDGSWYTRCCLACEMENGACAGEYIEKYNMLPGNCVACDSKNVIWKFVF